MKWKDRNNNDREREREVNITILRLHRYLTVNAHLPTCHESNTKNNVSPVNCPFSLNYAFYLLIIYFSHVCIMISWQLFVLNN